MIPRDRLLDRLRLALCRSRIVALLGPRQAGKTTLARHLAQQHPSTFFDLQDPTDLARLALPKLVLAPLTGLVILDEIQIRPDLLPIPRVLADRPSLPARFLLLGSASPDLVRGASESLADRLVTVSWRGGLPHALSYHGSPSRDQAVTEAGPPGLV